MKSSSARTAISIIGGGVILTCVICCFVWAAPAGEDAPPADTSPPGGQPETDYSFLYRNWLLEVAGDLILDGERAIYQSLRSEEDRGYFQSIFWARRDPTPDTVHNEFKIAFLKRKNRARNLFSTIVRLPQTEENAGAASGSEHGTGPSAGTTLPGQSSKTEEFRFPGDLTDMGRIYSLFGQPDGGLEETFHPADSAEAKATLRSSFTWIYRERSLPPPLTGQHVFHFTDSDGDGVPDLQNDSFFARTVPELAQTLIHWPDVFYAPGGRPLDGRPLDSVDEIELVASLQQHARRNHDPVLMDVKIKPDVGFFRGNQGKSRVWLNSVIFVRRGQGLIPYRLKQNQGAENLRIRGLVVGADAELAEKFHGRAERVPDPAPGMISLGSASVEFLSLTPDESGGQGHERWRFRRVFSLTPGQYTLYLIASDRATSKTGWCRVPLHVPDLHLPQLSTSSLVVGSGPEPFPLIQRPMPDDYRYLGVQLTPVPSRVMAPLPIVGGPAFLYHVYLSAEGGQPAISSDESEEDIFQTRYSLRRTDGSLVSLPGHRGMESRWQVEGDPGHWKVLLDLSGTELLPDGYQLEVEVKDPRSMVSNVMWTDLALADLEIEPAPPPGSFLMPRTAMYRPEASTLPDDIRIETYESDEEDQPAVVITYPTPRENIFEIDHLEAVPRRGMAGLEAKWVDFYVDGDLLLRDYQAPYRCGWQAFPAADNYTISAKCMFPGGLWVSDTISLSRPKNFYALDVELQQLFVTATDSVTGAFIGDLEQDEFILAEDYLEQRISHFERRTRRDLAICYLFDMEIDPQQAFQRLKEGVVGHLSERFEQRDQAFVAAYHVKTRLIQELTNHRGLLVSAIRSLSPIPDALGRRSERLVEAVAACAAELEQVRGRKKVLILLSDGKNVSAAVSNRALADQLQRSGITLYAIGFNTVEPLSQRQRADLTTPASAFEKTLKWLGFSNFFKKRDARRAMARNLFLEKRISASLLDTLAIASGGQYFPFETTFSTVDIRRVLEAVEEEQHNQYFLGYTSSNPSRDGNWRTVEVGIRDRQDVILRSRHGYFAPSSGLLSIEELEQLFTGSEGDPGSESDTSESGGSADD